MLPSDRQKPFLLSEDKNNKIHLDLKNDYLDSLGSYNGDFALVIFIGGQPGSGKTSLRNQLLNGLQLYNACVVINTDDLRKYHPAYKEFLWQ